MQKLRIATWYWGNFVTRPLKHTKRTDYELYNEEKHGWHRSEEFKNGQLKPYEVPNDTDKRV